MLNATAEFFSDKVIVQQVKKMRASVLVVFEDEETRDRMVKQSQTSNWKINGHLIGPCYPDFLWQSTNAKAKTEYKNKKQKTTKKRLIGYQYN
eukprot:TRINITY_DN1976_c0_g1_i1.p2 TRINITY_DN1976_c0_g1~~TRINITY_DN1976_c0_g1_i1.p2  ORF type:complete len:93 (-),score=13.97 TRINITY_DN1976_c0_g1_i1:111-389(-)